MFSLGNVKERILEKRIRNVQESTDKKIREMEQDLKAMKRLLDDVRKENESLRKTGEELRRGEESIVKNENALMKGEGEFRKFVAMDLKKGGEILKKEMDDIKKGVHSEISRDKEEVRKKSDELLRKQAEIVKKSEDMVRKEEDEIKKIEKDIYEKIKSKGLLQTEPAEETAQAVWKKDEGVVGLETGDMDEIKNAGENTGKNEKDRKERGGKKEKGRDKESAKADGSDAVIENEEEEAERITGFSRSMETPLDKLLELVTQKGKVRIDQAAKIFKAKEKQIDEWARILEEHNLIEIHYPAMGKPLLKIKSRK